MTRSDQETAVLAAGRYLSLVRRGPWEYATRGRVGAVGIVAVTDQSELVLVEQFRIPLGRSSIELPAGLVGDEQAEAAESPLQAGRRELLEETGFTAREWKLGPVLATSGGLTDETVTLLLARGLVRQNAGGGVGGEAIAVHLAPLAGIDAWLEARVAAGAAIESRILAGLYLWQRLGGLPW